MIKYDETIFSWRRRYYKRDLREINKKAISDADILLKARKYGFKRRRVEMKTVCLCGSFRFYQEMSKIEEILVKSAIKCIKPVPFPHGDARKSRTRKEEKIGTKEHIENVKQADIIYVVDKDGYVGRSTSVEIGVAYGLGKEIYAMKQIKDTAVDILVDEVLSLEELISRIKH